VGADSDPVFLDRLPVPFIGPGSEQKPYVGFSLFRHFLKKPFGAGCEFQAQRGIYANGRQIFDFQGSAGKRSSTDIPASLLGHIVTGSKRDCLDGEL
jgi:hypothetical protein